jgi:peptide/nickel transport system substrate-binding protein
MLAVAVALSCGLVWGLAGALADSGSPAPAAGPVLHIGWTSEPDNLNPFIGYADQTYEIWALNYSTLFGSGPDNEPTLDLATQFPTQENGGISADGKVWTIHIRSGVKWQDGVPLTAADVAFTFDYIVKHDMTNWTNYTAGIESVTALDPTTVRIVCSAPKANMEKCEVPILPEHIWSHVSPSAAGTSYSVKYPLVGSGPFETVAFKKGSYIEMVRNPYWYGKKPTIDKIYFEMYQDPDTMVSDLQTGALDAAWGIPEAQFKALRSSPGFKAVAYTYYNWDYLEFNCYDKASSLGNPVLRDWRFRYALNYAVDRQQLISVAYQGLATPGYTVIPPHTFYNPDYHWQPPAGQLYTFDLTKASQLLTAAGYPLVNGRRLNKQGKPIVLRLFATTENPPGQIEAKLIAGWLGQLGLKIRLSVIDPGQLTSQIYNAHGTTWEPDFDLAVWYWEGYFDPGLTLNCFQTSEIGTLNEPYWSDPQFDALAVQQGQTLDPLQRQRIIWRMQQMMYQQTPWIVLTHPQELEAYNTSRWTGWHQMFDGTGPAFCCEGYDASYLDLQPVSAAAAHKSSATILVLALVAVVAVVIVVLALWLAARRRGGQAEEA